MARVPPTPGKRRRNLKGPHEFYEELIASEVDPSDLFRLHEEAVEANPAGTARAESAMEKMAESAMASTKIKLDGDTVAYTRDESGQPQALASDAQRQTIDLRRDPLRAEAWRQSLLRSLDESAPMFVRCRHVRAAGSGVFEIRSVAWVGAGFWKCLDCQSEIVRKQGPTTVEMIWTDQCDLCGMKSDEGYAPQRFVLGGVTWQGDICRRCNEFWDGSPALTDAMPLQD